MSRVSACTHMHHCTIIPHSDWSVLSGIGDDRSLLSTFVFTWWPDDPTRSTVTLWITQLCCLWSCCLELSTSSCSTLIFIIILWLQPSQIKTELFAGHMMIAYLYKNGQMWISLFTYLLPCTILMAIFHVDLGELVAFLILSLSHPYPVHPHGAGCAWVLPKFLVPFSSVQNLGTVLWTLVTGCH